MQSDVLELAEAMREASSRRNPNPYPSTHNREPYDTTPTRPKPKPKPKPNQVLREHACGPGALVDARDDIDDWGVAKPAELANLPTERENACVSKGLPVYRALFSRAV